MSQRKTPKLPLTAWEKEQLKAHKIKTSELRLIPFQDLGHVLGGSENRARELIASAEFQSIPSIGPKFAEDIIGLGYYSLAELREQSGASLFEQLEKQHGITIDPCVEDQFWLVVDYANHPDSGKQWWDFTEERKRYREQYGYPYVRL